MAALGEAVARHVHGGLRAQRAAEHPHQRHPADVGVDRRLDHLGDERPGRVAAQRLAGRAVASLAEVAEVDAQARRAAEAAIAAL